MLNNFCFHVYAQKSLSHTFAFTTFATSTTFTTFNLSFNHSRHAEQVLFSSLCSKVTLTLSHSLTRSLPPSHLTLSLTHLLTLDMLNNFCFHVYAQKSLFIAENCNAFSLTSSSSSAAAAPYPLTLEFLELVPS